MVSNNCQQHGACARVAQGSALMLLLCHRRVELLLNNLRGEQLSVGEVDLRQEKGWSRGRLSGNTGPFYRETDE